ncbi:MAG: RagB/SusD family nutrient uptake outer membrane protein [Microscillaceae bacterium]|nr:RagB/SusD family nutrient uptake outer membrane protein [Microscillaceae bacterium]
MKLIKLNHIIAFVLIWVICGCSDFLDLSPQSEANVENFYRDAEDFENAVLAAYSALQSGSQYGSSGTDEFGGNFYAIMEVRGDDTSDGSLGAGNGIATAELDLFIESAGNIILAQTWGSLYQGINRCNIVLNRIDGVSMDQDIRNQLKGEVSFIRALSYFNLVRIWGDVPLVLTEVSVEDARNTIRNPVGEVYEAIIADLTFAQSTLPNFYGTSKLGRATSQAASALLGKVYLTLKRYNEASTVLKAVINSGVHSLLDDITDVFAPTNKGNNEIIFSVRFLKGGSGEGNSGFGTPNVQNLVPFYDPNDLRLALLDTIEDPNSVSKRFLRKFFDPASSAGDRAPDFPVLRYADVLLMAAEALNEESYTPDGEAFNYINQVRTRAGVNTYTSADLADQASFREAVLSERKIEFPLELQRWFDLIRTERAIDAIGSIGITINSNRLLFPIPQREIDVYNNPIGFPQNPGY